MIIGHKKQREFLKRAYLTGKLSHAYLFFGSEKIGKRTVALEFAKFIVCQEQDLSKRPCEKCPFCRSLEKNIFLDLVQVTPDSSGEIKIGEVRNLILRMSLRSSLGVFKIGIIDNAHLMNREAQNCFLKLLEEPKGDSLFMLVTSRKDSLLPTILSRVQKVGFSGVSKKEIKSFLISNGAGENNAENIAILSLGKPGQALDFFLKPEIMEERKKIEKDFIKLSKSCLAERFEFVRKIAENEDEDKNGKILNVLNIWVDFLRGLLLARITNGNSRNLNKIKNIIEKTQQTNNLILTTNVNLRMALDNLVVEI